MSGWSSPRTLLATAQRVLVEAAGLLVLALKSEDVRQVVGRGQGVRVVVAEDAAAAGECVFGQAAGSGVGTQGGQVDDEVVGRGQRAGMIGPRTSRRRVSVSSARRHACAVSLSARSTRARLLADDRVSGWLSPRMRRRRASVSSARRRARCRHPGRPGRRRGCWPRTTSWGGPRRESHDGGQACPRRDVEPDRTGRALDEHAPRCWLATRFADDRRPACFAGGQAWPLLMRWNHPSRTCASTASSSCTISSSCYHAAVPTTAGPS